MTWPTAATKVHMDAGTDDPKQARAELADLVDQFNTLRSHFSALAQTLVAYTAASNWRTDLDAQQLINSLTAETAPATGDLIGLRDISAGADRKMTLANMLKVINLLTQDVSPDGAADFLVAYDTSAGAAKKVLIDDLGGVFTESFGSSGQTITSAGSLSLAHGLSGTPRLVQARLVCTSAELGYSTNDVVVVNNHSFDGNDKGHSVVINNSTIDVRFGADPKVYNLIRKDNGLREFATNANWNFLVNAWR